MVYQQNVQQNIETSMLHGLDSIKAVWIPGSAGQIYALDLNDSETLSNIYYEDTASRWFDNLDTYWEPLDKDIRVHFNCPRPTEEDFE